MPFLDHRTPSAGGHDTHRYGPTSCGPTIWAATEIAAAREPFGPPGANTPNDAPKAAGIGTPVRDGKFEFTVASVEPGVPSIGTEPLEQKAQGKFVVVRLTVANIGDKVDGALVFDVPVDAVPTSLELHDSAFSGGTKVQLNP